jgi:hypothetical protein
VGKLMVDAARVLPLCAVLLVLPAIAAAKRRLQIPLVQTFQDVAYRHRREGSLFLAILILYFPFLVYANQTITYSGPFTNTTVNAHGTVVMIVNIGTNNVISGYINFTQSPGQPILCGAGDFTIDGSQQGNSIEFSFISKDLDPSCGFDWGLHFTVSGTLSEGGRVFEGHYFINTGHRGIFRVTIQSPPAGCADAYFIGAHGTAEGPDGSGRATSRVLLETAVHFLREKPGNARVKVDYLVYPAADLTYLLLLAPELAAALFINDLIAAKDSGVIALNEHVRNTVLRECPNPKIVLVGYSLGAWVIDDWLSRRENEILWQHIRAVELYGDPQW